MDLELRPSTRDRINRSPHRQELAEFAAWLQKERYTDFVCDQHLRRLVFILPRLSRDSSRAAYTDAELERAFGPERSPQSRLYRFAGTRRAYRRFLAASGRLGVEPSEDRSASIRGDYAAFLVEVRGLSLSARQHHAQEVTDFLTRGLRPGQQLGSLTRADVEHFILTRSREVSRHSLQHTVGILRSFLRYLFQAATSRRRWTPWTPRARTAASCRPARCRGRRFARCSRRSIGVASPAGATCASCILSPITGCVLPKSSICASTRSTGKPRSFTFGSARRAPI